MKPKYRKEKAWMRTRKRRRGRSWLCKEISVGIKCVRKGHEARQINGTIRGQNKAKNGTGWRQWDKYGYMWEEGTVKRLRLYTELGMEPRSQKCHHYFSAVNMLNLYDLIVCFLNLWI